MTQHPLMRGHEGCPLCWATGLADTTAIQMACLFFVYEEHVRCWWPWEQSISIAAQAYCEDDYYGLFAPRCAKCSKSVRDTVVSALNSQWHPECFVCTVCKAHFADQVCVVWSQQNRCI